MSSLNDNALISLDEVREALNLSNTEVNDDGMIAGIINRVSSKIENFCGRTFAASYYTEYHDGDGSTDVILDQYPIIKVSGLWDDGNREFGSDCEIESDEYVIYANEGRISLYGGDIVIAGDSASDGFTCGKQNIKVCYSGGYYDIPEDLKGACLDWVLHTYRRIKDKSHSFSSRSYAGVSAGLDLSAIPSEVRSILYNYKKMNANVD